MNIPEALEAIIIDFDDKMARLSTDVIQSALSSARAELKDNAVHLDTWADLAAFTFQVEQEDREPWHI